jgi:transglutaminase-like putative cysteine protease
VQHTTEYRYSSPVVSGQTIAHLRPRSTPMQSVVSSTVATSPVADHTDDYLDSFGNHVSYLAIEQLHDLFLVTGECEVEIGSAADLLWSPAWEHIPAIVNADHTADGLLARFCSNASTLVTPSADLARFASWSFLPGRPFHEAVADLSRRIFTEFIFDPGFSDISTPLAEVLTYRRGVCQDFAHLAIGVMRSLGLPARYVSGYIENEPPPGKPKLVGADASHAWCSIYVPGWGWFDFDPTNDHVPPRNHVTVAWGRDYSDVAPVRGVVFGSPASQVLTVAVDVTRLDR